MISRAFFGRFLLFFVGFSLKIPFLGKLDDDTADADLVEGADPIAKLLWVVLGAIRGSFFGDFGGIFWTIFAFFYWLFTKNSLLFPF